MRRLLVVLIVAILLFFSYFLVNITGFLVGNESVEVSIGEKLEGKITAMTYPGSIWLGQIMDIGAEFQNTGSVSFSTSMEIKIYYFLDNVLNLTASYYDFSRYLEPGEPYRYEITYFPVSDGPYYIQVRAPYDGKVAEMWGAFYVYPLNWTPPIYECETQCVYIGYSYGACRQECQSGENQSVGICSNPAYPLCCCGGYNATTISTTTIEGNITISTTTTPFYTISTTSTVTPTTATTSILTTSTIGIPRMDVDYPQRIELYPGESRFFNISVNNTGEVDLTRLRLYLSTTDMINTSINPKVIFDLPVNDSTLFLVTLDVPFTMTPGDYTLDFELISRETKAGYSSLIRVLPEEISLKDLIERTILNYKILISQIESEIISMHINAYDVRLANQSIGYAKANLTYAEDLYNLEEYDASWRVLRDVKKNIEDAVFQLGHATLKIRAEPTVFLVLLLLLPILVTIIFVTYYMVKKKREERPRLLRRIKQ